MGSKILGKAISPRKLKELLPLEEKHKQIIEKSRNEINNALYLSNPEIKNIKGKKVVLLGPCSIDDFELAIKYAKEVKRLQEKVGDSMILVMRYYVEKPRTTYGRDGISLCKPLDWKKEGLDNPNLIDLQWIKIRETALEITEIGVPLCTEMLDADMMKAMDDIYSLDAIGARTSTSPKLRKVASGLDVAIAVKNPMSGDIQEMIQNIISVQSPQNYRRGDEYHLSDGNPNTVGVLRGGKLNGKAFTNYGKEHLMKYIKLVSEKYAGKIQDNGLIIDLNHDNSDINDGQADQKHLRQPLIIEELISVLIELKREGIDVDNLWKGIMMESYFEDGKQAMNGEVDGLSRTDPCLGLENTEKSLMRLAELINAINDDKVISIKSTQKVKQNNEEQIQVGKTGTNGGFK